MKHTLIESILKEVGTYYNDKSNYLIEEKKTGEDFKDGIENVEQHGYETNGTPTIFNMDQLEENNVYDIDSQKGDMTSFASKGYGYRH